MKLKLLIVEGTLRKGRRSISVAQFIEQEAKKRDNLEVKFIDVKELDLPVLDERRHHMDEEDIPPALQKWKEAVDWSDGIIPVIPEYNGSFPAAFKNIFDALYPEYKRKPFAICSVSYGYGGYTVVTMLREIVNRAQGFIVPRFWMARNVTDAFDDDGNVQNEQYKKDCKGLLDEWTWYTEAITRHLHRTESDD